MIIPEFLKPGDTVAIVATGRKILRSQLDPALEMIQSWGCRVLLPDELFSDKHSYLAGSDEERLGALQFCINNIDVKAIICARGGYGTSRIVDRIDFEPLRLNPKWIVGFSDVTALHLKLAKLGLCSIHGTMPILFTKDGSNNSNESLKKTLFSGPEILHAPNSSFNRKGVSVGRIIGGNLSLIVDSLGTTSEPEVSDLILVIEEIDEYLYRCDRMLNHLKRSGLMSRVKGLIVGYMTDIKDQDAFNQRIEEIVLDKVSEYSFPIAFGFPIGHEQPNLSWVHNSFVRLEVTDGGATIFPQQVKSLNI